LLHSGRLTPNLDTVPDSGKCVKSQNGAAILLLRGDQNDLWNQILVGGIFITIGKYALLLPYVIARKMRGPPHEEQSRRVARCTRGLRFMTAWKRPKKWGMLRLRRTDLGLGLCPRRPRMLHMHHRRKRSLRRLCNHLSPVACRLAFEHPGHHRSLTKRVAKHLDQSMPGSQVTGN
jgi:hypothetical protein